MTADRLPDARPGSGLPLRGRYLDHLRAERGLARNTLEAYRRDLGRYGDYLAEVGITDPRTVATEDLQAFVAWLRSRRTAAGRPYATSSVARIVVAVRGFHRFLAREGLTADGVAAPVSTPRSARSLP